MFLSLSYLGWYIQKYRNPFLEFNQYLSCSRLLIAAINLLFLFHLLLIAFPSILCLFHLVQNLRQTMHLVLYVLIFLFVGYLSYLQNIFFIIKCFSKTCTRCFFLFYFTFGKHFRLIFVCIFPKFEYALLMLIYLF